MSVNNKLLTLCLTGSLVLPTGTAATAQPHIEETPTGPVELPQTLTVSPVAKPVAAERDSWTATTEQQLAAIKAAEAARKATAARIAAAAETKRLEAERIAAAARAATAKKKAAAIIAAAPKTAAAAAISWLLPVRLGNITSGYGWRPRPIPGVRPFHYGTDIAKPCGTPIKAARGGRVTQAGWYGSYGNWVLIDHGRGISTGYAHSSRIIVRVGQTVKLGQVIGYVGRTGAATGCHLHFEVRKNGAPINPMTFVSWK